MPDKSSKTTNLWEMFLADEELHDVWHEPRRVADDEDNDHDDGRASVLCVALLQLVLVHAANATEAVGRGCGRGGRGRASARHCLVAVLHVVVVGLLPHPS